MGRTITLTDEPESTDASLSDSKKLWFLCRSITRLCQALDIPCTDLAQAFASDIGRFLRDTSDANWQTIFHRVESLNSEVIVELQARGPLSSKAYRAGKMIAQFYWARPTVEEVKQRIAADSTIDAYTLLRGLETHAMAELIRDLRELDSVLPLATFPALASGISAWEIKGRLVRDGTKLKERETPKRSFRELSRTLPVIWRFIRRPARVKPVPPDNVRLTAAEADMIRKNLRAQSAVWRSLIFETRLPSRLVRPSDWYRINITVNIVLWLGALAVATFVAAIGLALVFFAGPGLLGLAKATYGDQEVKASQLIRSLSFGPLFTAGGSALARFQDLSNVVRRVTESVRRRLVGATIRRQAVRAWNAPLGGA